MTISKTTPPSSIILGGVIRNIAVATVFTSAIFSGWTQTTSDITLNVHRPNGGTVISSPPGIHCGTNAFQCTTTYKAETSVTLNAIPDNGYRIGYWRIKYPRIHWSPDGQSLYEYPDYILASGNSSLNMDNFHGKYKTIHPRFLSENTRKISCETRQFNSTEEFVIGLYNTYYGRPADVGGLNYWSNKIANSLEYQYYGITRDFFLSIAQEFFNSQEYENQFASLSNSEFINHLYLRLFNRLADPAGMAWYEALLNNGHETRATIVYLIMESAAGGDSSTAERRDKVARHFVTVSERKWGLRAPPAASEEELTDILMLANPNVFLSNTDFICEEMTRLVEQG